MIIPAAILDYLKTQRVGVLAVEMLDGSPHGATVHFAHTDKPLVFYFETTPSYRKAEALTGREQSRATFVVGCDESTMKTLQLDGIIQLVDDRHHKQFEDIYFGKFSEKKAKYKDQHLFTFTPTWWRFTDWTTPKGKTILTSDA